MTPRILSLVVLLRALSLLGGEVIAADGDLAGAQAVDPVSFYVRQAQVEVLLRISRGADTFRMDEAVLVARATWRLFPGNVEAQSAYATALAMRVLHGAPAGPDLAAEAWAAAGDSMDRDPASSNAIDRMMFLLAADRQDLGYFQRLGVRRAQLTGEKAGVDMRCRLCEKGWLEHRRQLSGVF